MKSLSILLLALLLCSPAGAQELSLPAQLEGKAAILNADDADYGRAVISSAVKPSGQGGVSSGLVVRLSQDISVYRLWNGAAKVDARGNTNRLGGWWSYDAPRGAAAQYRIAYEICKSWNDLTWVATCTLKQGSVVAIGPGQSVSADVCGDSSGQERYAANAADWQMYIDKPWARPAELACPSDSEDYEANPDDIAKPTGI